ncbi:MAG: hypothetical protein IJX60_03640, partial [Paludibacteraceae bacterium]|nr:hypothetical protein [Paludibacteraceae bacterium]
MNIKNYIPFLVILACVLAVACITYVVRDTNNIVYSEATFSTYHHSASPSLLDFGTTFQSVTPQYMVEHPNPAHAAYAAPVQQSNGGSVYSDRVFHQPAVTTFGESGYGYTDGTTQLFHAAPVSNPTTALAVSMPMPKRNSHATTHRTNDHQAAAAQQHSGATTYTAHALPMRSAGRSTSADASVAPLATTTYDENYSINGNANQLNGRRNTIDLGGGTLPDNPIEPGTSVGDVPWLFILCLSLAYAMLRFRKRIATLFMLCIIATASYAVPARPGWQTKTQPDGTTIEVRLTGDEF